MATVELGPLADRLKQAHIIIPIDLSAVTRMEPGASVQMMADGGVDLYVVNRDSDTVSVFTIDADNLRLEAF